MENGQEGWEMDEFSMGRGMSIGTDHLVNFNNFAVEKLSQGLTGGCGQKVGGARS